MKRITTLLIIMTIAGSAVGQNLVGKSFVVDVPDTKFFKIDTANKKTGSNNFIYAGSKVKFTVIDLVEGGAIIKFWNFGNGAALSAVTDVIDYSAVKAYADTNTNGRHFMIDMADLDTKCSPYNGSAKSFTWGAVTIPIKMRFGDGDTRYFGFEPTANLGLTAGYRYQIKGRANHALNFLGGTSIGSTAFRKVDFDSAYVAQDTSFNFEGTGLILSTILGVVYQYDSFQIGLFTGFDFLPSELGRNWKHQGVPWLGVGIGIGLFSKDKSDNGQGKN